MNKLKYPTLAILISVSFCGILTSISHVDAAPSVSIDPACGPSRPGFATYVTASGFSPDANINWQLVDSHGSIAMYGHFQSNSQGGFYDVTHINTLAEGNYSINFGTDANNDNKFDEGNATASVKLSIPCPTG